MKGEKGEMGMRRVKGRESEGKGREGRALSREILENKRAGERNPDHFKFCNNLE